MLESASNILFQDLTGIKPGMVLKSSKDVDDIIYKSKRVRSKDYVFNFDVDTLTPGPNPKYYKTVTTTARWKFIITGAAVYMSDPSAARLSAPKIGITFESASSRSTTRGNDPQDENRVMAGLVFPIEGEKALQYFPNSHFEEYKTVCQVLDQRVDITVCYQTGGYGGYHATVILTGLEIFEGGDDE